MRENYGLTGGIEAEKTWEFNGTDWTETFPATVPSRRSGMAINWIDGAMRASMCGGYSAGHKSDTWVRSSCVGTGSFTVAGAGCATSAGLVGGLSAAGVPTIGQNLVVNLPTAPPAPFP